ncbi:hypothetical protein PBRA_009680 [Plasmodiophora brassicae]|uniref:Reverse transcriptase n=1 Tax=Plasmodiophora brassicae TaxID=37360 RepID=A0A0G4IKR0_PLABS|nr:hypothetical protein PBRA_009680 [Plasmodiophora brassicae]
MEQGLPRKWRRRLRRLAFKRWNVWRTKLGPDPAAKVTPCRTRLRQGARPYRCKARRYSKEQSEFLEQFVSLLKKYGLVYENYNSEWASPVVVVRKPGNRGWRMCVDLREVNKLCEATAWPMPFLEAILQHLAGSKYWFSLDAFKGFWLMPLAKECQEIFSFATDRGIYTPTRTIQGGLNSSPQFQARMAEIFSELLMKALIIWIDDILGHARTEQERFRVLDMTLQLAEKHNLKFNLDKCDFFLRKVKFAGRIFTPEGTTHDPERIRALQEMQTPRTARDLQQFLYAVQWMSKSIPEYSRIALPLQEIYEKSMKDQPKRTRSVAGGVRLKRHGWSELHDTAFEELKELIGRNTQLAYPRKDMIQCVFADASKYHRAGMVTQIPMEDRDLPIWEAHHQPLGFSGHKFAGSELNWATPDKEASALLDVVEKLEYLLQTGKPFRLYTDHRNLMHIYDPQKCTQPAAERLERWGMRLRKYNFVIEHIPGDKNVWADLQTRWGAETDLGRDADLEHQIDTGRVKYGDTTNVFRILRIRSDEDRDSYPEASNGDVGNEDQEIHPETHDRGVPNNTGVENEDQEIHPEIHQRWGQFAEKFRIQPTLEEKLIWPTETEISERQLKFFTNDKLRNLRKNEAGSWVNQRGQVVIPSEDVEMRVRLTVIAHAAGLAHRSINQMTLLLRSKFLWNGISADIKQIAKNCLHCRPTRGGEVRPRPLGPACHAKGRGEVLHMDYLYMMPSQEEAGHDFKWILVLRDDFSGLVHLVPTIVPDSLVTVQALMEWRSKNGTPKTIVSDQASYFMSEVTREYNKLCNVKQHWTTAYIHYPNGTVEVVNRHVLALFRTICSDLRWQKEEWPWLLKVVEHVLNHRPQQRLGGRAPVQVHSGLEPDNPLDGICINPVRETQINVTEMTSDEIVKLTDELIAALNQMHKEVADLSERQRAQRRQKVSENRIPPNVYPGDFVLRAETLRAGEKLFLKWRGPYRVTDVHSGYVFEVEDIISGDKHVVHGSRLQFYCDKNLNITEELREQIAYDNAKWEIDTISDARMNREQTLELLIKWRGFSEDESSWEPAQIIIEDQPRMVQEFIDEHKSHALATVLQDMMPQQSNVMNRRSSQPKQVKAKRKSTGKAEAQAKRRRRRN